MSSENRLSRGEEMDAWIAAYEAADPETRRFLAREIVTVDPPTARKAFLPDHDPAQFDRVVTELGRLRASADAREMFEQERRGDSGKPVFTDMEHLVRQIEDGSLDEPRPSIGGVLYAGRVNAVYGDYTAGKTWLALAMALEHMRNGGRALFVDFEDSAAGIAARCLALDRSLGSAVTHLQAPGGQITADHVREVIAEKDIGLVVIDSTGEALAAAGYSPNSDDEVARWFRAGPDAIAALGPAVLLLDHVAKRNEGIPTPVGSFRKGAAITGAQFVLESKQGFSKDHAGWSRLTCTKDRCGYFSTGEVVGTVDFTPVGGGLKVDLVMGRDSHAPAFAGHEANVMAHFKGGAEAQSLTQIRSAVTGDSAKVAKAVRALEQRGHLEVETVKRGNKPTDVYSLPASGFTPIGDMDLI